MLAAEISFADFPLLVLLSHYVARSSASCRPIRARVALGLGSAVQNIMTSQRSWPEWFASSFYPIRRVCVFFFVIFYYKNCWVMAWESVLWGHSDLLTPIIESVRPCETLQNIIQPLRMKSVLIGWKNASKTEKPARPLKGAICKNCAHMFHSYMQVLYFAPCDPLRFFLWPLWENQDPV